MEKSTNIDRSGENRLLIGAVKACASVAAERHAGEGDLSDVRSRGMRPIRLHLTTTFAIPVATDVTMLLGASSFMTPVGGRVDPRAADAFDAVATAYCNGADLYVPLLSSGLSELPLIDLWNRNAAVQRVVAAEITEDELDAVTALLAEHVAAFIEGDPFAVARWVAFHFSQTTVDVHVRRFHLESIRRAGPTARRIITDMKLPAFRNAVEMIQRDSELSAPREYQSLVGTSEIPSLFHLVVAFVISISIRGYAYAQGLDLLSSRPVYRYHWIRSAALRYGLIPIPGADELPTEWIPWGTILKKIFDPAAPVCERSPARIVDVMAGLRERTPALRTELTKTSDDALPASALTPDEVLLLDILRDLEIVPRYADTTTAQKLVEWLRTLVETSAPVWKLPIQLMTSALQPQAARDFEMSLRRAIRRDTFWDIFENPGLRASLREYQTRQRREG